MKHIVVVAVSVFATFQDTGMEMLLVEYGHGQFIKWLPIPDVANLGPDKSSGILFFHVLLAVILSQLFDEMIKKCMAGMEILPSSDFCFQEVKSVPTSCGTCRLQCP